MWEMLDFRENGWLCRSEEVWLLFSRLVRYKSSITKPLLISSRDERTRLWRGRKVAWRQSAATKCQIQSHRTEIRTSRLDIYEKKPMGRIDFLQKNTDNE